MPTFMPAFDRHIQTGQAIGRVVVGYGELEYEFCRLVAAATCDYESARNLMFGARGETRRLNVGDELIRNLLPDGIFRTYYQETLGHLRYCLSIRNQYAHCQWTETMSGHDLAFVDLEEVADANANGNAAIMTIHAIPQDLAEAQLEFFRTVSLWLNWIRLELDCDAGRSSRPHFLAIPMKPKRPALHMNP